MPRSPAKGQRPCIRCHKLCDRVEFRPNVATFLCSQCKPGSLPTAPPAPKPGKPKTKGSRKADK